MVVTLATEATVAMLAIITTGGHETLVASVATLASVTIEANNIQRSYRDHQTQIVTVVILATLANCEHDTFSPYLQRKIRMVMMVTTGSTEEGIR